MATISSRVDDRLKARAEAVADAIGLSLSSVIAVFLKRFADEQGFPFELKAVDINQNFTALTKEQVTAIVQQRVASSSLDPEVPAVTYLDPETNTLITQRKQ